jgi:hypothetical protein
MKKKLRNSSKKVSKNTSSIKCEYPIYCIGKNYFLQEKDGTLYTTTLAILKDQYGNDVKANITYLVGFVNEPSHTDYQQIYNNKYNTYKKMLYKPLKGEWATIKGLLTHIFQDQYQMGLEYFWNLYLHPKQKLPFLGIVSEAKGTGKSTFLFFMQILFEGNCSIVSAHDFTSNFTSSYASSLVCTSDEHCEVKSRTTIAQKMKTLITESKIRYEAKGQDAITIDWHGKFVFASNNADKLTFIEDENTRYWIIEISQLKTKSNDFMFKAEAEIPAFLSYLKNEFKARPRRDRLYFLPSEFQTDASRNVQANSKSTMYGQIEEAMTTYFEDNDKTEAYARPKELAMLMGLHIKEEVYIRRVLKKEFKLLPTTQGIRYTNVLHDKNCNGKPFVFKREDFIKDELVTSEDDQIPF